VSGSGKDHGIPEKVSLELNCNLAEPGDAFADIPIAAGRKQEKQK